MSEAIKILCVDDKPENILAITNMLGDLNVHLIAAHSGEEALDLLCRHEVALILMDVKMPEMDGHETVRLIRERRKAIEIPVIFITAASVGEEGVFKGYDYGAVDYLTKPIIPEVLKSKVRVFVTLYEQHIRLQERTKGLEQARERITAQQQALAESEAKFRTAFEQSFQFMAILDVEGRVIELNRLATKLCGDYRGEIAGQYLWNICWLGQDEENERLRQVIAKAAKGRCTADEARFIDINGEVYILSRTVAPVRNSQGEIVYITIQGHDISGRIRAEERQHNLEVLLQQAQKMEALGVLAGGIAHDFNNILSIIIGNTELAKRHCPPESDMLQFLEDTGAAGQKARDLVKQILSFSRQADTEKGIVEPATIVEESLKLLRASIPATIEIEQDIDTDCAAIYADSTQFHQVVMNLCTNAYHAMEESGGKLTLRLREETIPKTTSFHGFNCREGKYVKLSVMDTGYGIDSGLVDKIFEPYFTTKEDGKGTGMGLSIVYGIVKGHNGAVWAESPKDGGTAFHVYFPVAGSDDRQWKRKTARLAGGDERILLVDDEERVLEMVGEMLKLVGYQVTVSNNSRNALDIFTEQPEYYDLVITDQTMPSMTGIELAEKILNLKPQVPIILCTGYSPTISREQVVALGIKDLVLKPLTLNELAHIVRRTLDQAA